MLTHSKSERGRVCLFVIRHYINDFVTWHLNSLTIGTETGLSNGPLPTISHSATLAWGNVIHWLWTSRWGSVDGNRFNVVGHDELGDRWNWVVDSLTSSDGRCYDGRSFRGIPFCFCIGETLGGVGRQSSGPKKRGWLSLYFLLGFIVPLKLSRLEKSKLGCILRTGSGFASHHSYLVQSCPRGQI